MIVRRRTLRSEVRFEGLGLHSGVPVNVRAIPGGQSIAFRLGRDRVAAIPANVSDTTRCTKLGQIATIEHLMSAFAALEITDVEVELDAPELPGLDGSALGFFRELAAVGAEDLGEHERADLFKRQFLQEDGGKKIAVGKGEGRWRYLFDTGARWPGPQGFEATDVLACYQTDIAPARTLVFAEEIELARQAGLGKGLTQDSVLIVGEAGYDNAPRFPDEPARHKLLDLIGDVYLSGIPIRSLDVVAERSGHAMNVRMAAQLASGA